jgi:hypothetical protein
VSDVDDLPILCRAPTECPRPSRAPRANNVMKIEYFRLHQACANIRGLKRNTVIQH